LFLLDAGLSPGEYQRMSETVRGTRGDHVTSSPLTSPGTFAHLANLHDIGQADVAVLCVPFDGGSLYRSGARFGPMAVRQASRTLRPYHPTLDVEPFAAQRVADAGDLVVNQLDIEAAIADLTKGAQDLLQRCRRIVTIGGDHTITLPLLRAVHERYGPIAIAHFDAHLDTRSDHLDAPYSHSTWLRRAIEEGLLLANRSVHVGLRGSVASREDYLCDSELGFGRVRAREVTELGASSVATLIRERAGGLPLYLSIDINVLDPAFAPGASNPEAGGLSSRELFAILTYLGGTFIASADVVEVCAAYDHSETTALAAANIVYDLLSLFALA
jgi:agmatinase